MEPTQLRSLTTSRKLLPNDLELSLQMTRLLELAGTGTSVDAHVQPDSQASLYPGFVLQQPSNQLANLKIDGGH